MTLKEVIAAQAEAEAEFTRLKEQGETLVKEGQPVDQALRDKIKAASEKVVELGTQRTQAEQENQQSVEDSAEFLRTIGAQVEPTLKPKPSTKAQRSGAAPVDQELTRDTVQVLLELARDRYGSNMVPDYPVNEDSERLVCDMFSCPDANWASNAALFQHRARQIQQRVANPVAAQGTDAAGGFIVPEDNSFMNEVLKARRAYGGVEALCRVITTATGAKLPIPTIDDTAATGAGKVDEGTNSADVQLAFGEASLGSHMVASGRLGATEQAIQDAGANLPMLLGMLAAERIERAEAAQFARGSGAAGNHTGVVTAFNQFTTKLIYKIATGQLTGPKTGNMWKIFVETLKYSVDAGWRQSPNYGMVLTDLLDMLFAGATDGDGRPLFEAWGLGNTALGQGVTFGGIRIRSDYSLAAPNIGAATDNQVAGVVGDLSQFWIRRVAGMRMVRDPYTQAQSFEVNWIFGRRSDSKGVLNATSATNPSARKIAFQAVA